MKVGKQREIYWYAVMLRRKGARGLTGYLAVGELSALEGKRNGMERERLEMTRQC
jgi:hypothetical protein